jgi:hypothetical protein
VAAYSNSWREKACHIATNSNHLFSFVDARGHLPLAPLSCPQPLFLPPRPRLGLQDTWNHNCLPLGGPFLPPPLEGARMGRGSRRAPCTPPSLLPPLRGAGRYVTPLCPLVHANAPLLCLAPVCARTGFVPSHAGVFRPPLTPPPAWPLPFAGARKVRDPLPLPPITR